MRYVRNDDGAQAWLLDSSKLRAALTARAELGRRWARLIAPVWSGDYKAGIKVEDGPHVLYPMGDYAPRMSVRIHATAPHSAAVEWGNRRRKGRHILRRIVPMIHDPQLPR